MSDAGTNGNGKWPVKERVFFWALLILTLLHIAVITAPSFGYNDPGHNWTKCYLLALGIYAGVRKWAQFGQKLNHKRRGEYFVILYWFVAVSLVLWKVFSSGPKQLIISPELWYTVIGVTLIYGAADLLKRIGNSSYVVAAKNVLNKLSESGQDDASSAITKD